MSDEANSAVLSSLTELRAALEAKLEARRVDGHSELETIYLHSLLTDDTVAALLDVARAAREHIAAWDATEEAIYERDETLHETQHGQVLSEQYRAELVDAVRKANVAEHHTADALRAALYALVGEDALECEAPPQPQQRVYATFKEAATTDAPDGATVTVGGREYEVVRNRRDVTRDAIIVASVAAWQMCEGCEVRALVRGSRAYARVAGSTAHAWAADSRAYAEAAGSRAYAWTADSRAHAWAADSHAYALEAGSTAHAWAAGSFAYACRGASAFAHVAGSTAVTYDGGTAFAKVADSYAYTVDGGAVYAEAAGSRAIAYEGGVAYAFAPGSRAYAFAPGSRAYAYNGDVAYQHGEASDE